MNGLESKRGEQGSFVTIYPFAVLYHRRNILEVFKVVTSNGAKFKYVIANL